MRLSDYISRIGVSGPVRPDLETLRRLHLAHREAFLFENITVQEGGSIPLGVGDLEVKFMDEGRGGYCFEHNTLFAAALRAIGFAPVTLLGRVRRGPPDRWCRTHMVLSVAIDSGSRSAERVLADVGFGATSLLEPIALREGAASIQRGLEYSLRRERDLWVLALNHAEGPMDLYEFSDDPQTPWDVEVANHFTATHPESIFRRTLTIQRTRGDERVILRNDTLTRIVDGRFVDAPIEGGKIRQVARELFGVRLTDRPLVFEQMAAAGAAAATPLPASAGSPLAS
ncbi:MAG TPA: arylamine N-acetyltransferase [Vicinamibacterales bacterium]